MVKESIIMAWSSLIANKLRTILTMLGIIIGVAAVIALVSVGHGVRYKIENNLSSLGSNLLFVSPSVSQKSHGRVGATSIKRITIKDFEAITHIPNVKKASPVMKNQFTLVYKNNHWTTAVTGANQDYKEIMGRETIKGRYITNDQVERREKVAVIGQKIEKELFKDSNPIGKSIRINNQPFKVIGVLNKKGSNGFGADEDDVLIIPYTTFMERLTGRTTLGSIFLLGNNKEILKPLELDIVNVLRLRHQSLPGDKDFDVESMDEIMKKVDETTGTLTLFLGAIAMVSLLVGGIGIMNIMLVSVTERTKEIGIRKALGATEDIIIMQFLIEAIFISFCGGCIGVALGFLASKGIGLIIDLKTVISPVTIFMSFGFAMTIGLLFGIYPAKKAAKLNPIDALHYE